MNIRRALDSVMPSALQSRIQELIRQSKHHQTELSRITEELDRLQCQIRAIGAPNHTDSVGEGEEERQQQA